MVLKPKNGSILHCVRNPLFVALSTSWSSLGLEVEHTLLCSVQHWCLLVLTMTCKLKRSFLKFHPAFYLLGMLPTYHFCGILC